MNNLFNTMNNLISSQNDSTFQNMETPIGQGVKLFEQIVNNAKEGLSSKELQNAVANGIGNTEVGNELKFQMAHERETANENDKMLETTLKWAEEQQAKEWERENEIRKETQEREDSALQRWVEDARKAGINPNLFSGQGAASGGGITSATGLNMSQYETQANRLLEEWQTMIEQDFERNENRKDRYTRVLTGLLNLAGLGIFAGKRK